MESLEFHGGLHCMRDCVSILSFIMEPDNGHCLLQRAASTGAKTYLQLILFCNILFYLILFSNHFLKWNLLISGVWWPSLNLIRGNKNKSKQSKAHLKYNNALTQIKTNNRNCFPNTNCWPETTQIYWMHKLTTVNSKWIPSSNYLYEQSMSRPFLHQYVCIMK